MLGGHTRGWIMGVPLMPKGVLGRVITCPLCLWEHPFRTCGSKHTTTHSDMIMYQWWIYGYMHRCSGTCPLCTYPMHAHTHVHIAMHVHYTPCTHIPCTCMHTMIM